MCGSYEDLQRRLAEEVEALTFSLSLFLFLSLSLSFFSYEDQQRRLAEEIETLKERLQKYSEVHALDTRSNNEKDNMVRSLQDEIARLRNQIAPR